MTSAALAHFVSRIRNVVLSNTKRPYVLFLSIGSDLDYEKCIPFVSQYSDCVEANLCSGCTRCTCMADSNWICEKVSECRKDLNPPVDEDTLDSALKRLYNEVNKKPKSKKKTKLQVESLLEGVNVKSKEDLLLDNNDDDIEVQIVKLISSSPRLKRSMVETNSNNQKNGTVQFYHTVDEINEDTLKLSNLTGTLGAAKIEPNIPNLSRRFAIGSQNISDFTSDGRLQYNKLTHSHIIADNKKNEQDNETIDHLKQNEVGIITNQTQKAKDSEISKLVVNELKRGKEYIGDKNAPVMSNITFAPENDTLTAMAFIAGNLLNKLWSMEKDSDESLETEVLKQEKIANLLDLFKDPLTLRQEEFLKNALIKLSQAMDKKRDITNYTLCEDIGKAKNFLADVSNSTWEKSLVDIPTETKNEKTSSSGDKKIPATQAVSKLKDVMSLIKKFESVNEQLVNLKAARIKKNQTKSTQRTPDFTEEERKTKNLFGTILEKITKLLLPDSHSKKLISKIRKHSVLNGNNRDIKKKFKHAFNFDLTNMTLTAKDKLVLDYLVRIQSDPSILFSSDIDNSNPSSNSEGEIMTNLSEFFKIKSFIDLMKLLDENKKEIKKKPQHLQNSEKYTESEPDEIETTTKMTTQVTYSSTKTPNYLRNTKNKLKTHLKTIIEDLVELQKEQGISTKEGEIRIADALPCIYKLLRSANKLKNKSGGNNDEKPEMLKVFGEMRQELKAIQNNKHTRRTLDNITADRPKSAAVWERIIKSIDQIQKKSSRRSLDNAKPKNYEELRKMMDQVESSSKLYKTNALHSDVPAAEKLILLRALEQDIEQYKTVLENIKLYLESNNEVTQEQYQELKDFIFNAGSNLKLDEKVALSLNKPKVSPKSFDDTLISKLNKHVTYKNEKLTSTDVESDVLPKKKDRNVEISRDDLLNQLIRNKVNQFIRTKEQEKDFTGINYGLAKNIIENLDKGDDKLARELYKIFVNNKLITPKVDRTDELDSERHKVLNKEPLIHFADPNSLPAPMSTSMNTKTNDLLRQLLKLQGPPRRVRGG